MQCRSRHSQTPSLLPLPSRSLTMPPSYAAPGTSAPAATCYTTQNPHYAPEVGAAARMADGRLFTDYRGRGQTYGAMAARTWGANEARQRMTSGAEVLVDAARTTLAGKVAPRACVDTMVPELYKRVCSWDGCKTIPGHYAGIGGGRVYVPSAAHLAAQPQALAEATVPPMAGTQEAWGAGAPRIAAVSRCASALLSSPPVLPLGMPAMALGRSYSAPYAQMQ